VAVLDPDLIPDLVDVVVRDFVYELQFRVEQEENDDDPKLIEMDAPEDPHDANKGVMQILMMIRLMRTKIFIWKMIQLMVAQAKINRWLRPRLVVLSKHHQVGRGLLPLKAHARRECPP
jgi:hypothetical protein